MTLAAEMPEVTEQFAVRNRFTDEVQFTAEIVCAPDALPSVKLGLAVKWAVKAGANLARANLADADLADAYLAGAYLASADLAGANLADAYLAGAKIKSLFAIASRINDPYTFHAYDTDQGIRIVAGCRNFSPAEYRAHVADSYADTPKGEETLAIIGFIEQRAAALNIAVAPAEAAQ